MKQTRPDAYKEFGSIVLRDEQFEMAKMRPRDFQASRDKVILSTDALLFLNYFSIAEGFSQGN